MSVHITNTDFLKLLLQTDLKYRDSYWVLQTREHLAKMSEITGRRLSREESIVNETEERLKSETTQTIIIRIRMISKKETQEKVRNSVYWGTDTKLLVEQKSQELQLSQNKITELCLQKYLPSMQWS